MAEERKGLRELLAKHIPHEDAEEAIAYCQCGLDFAYGYWPQKWIEHVAALTECTCVLGLMQRGSISTTTQEDCSVHGAADRREGEQGADDYVAWVTYKGSSIKTCDSDSEGAFKVYRHPAAAPSPSARAYFHKSIDRVQEMRKLDLERANDPAQEKERDYYLGRAHRCDDILFWLGELESRLPAGEQAAPGLREAPPPEDSREGRLTQFFTEDGVNLPQAVKNAPTRLEPLGLCDFIHDKEHPQKSYCKNWHETIADRQETPREGAKP